jgi:phosphatidate cytidylyltransferase
MRYDYMICPAKSLGISAWSGMTCDPNPVFKWTEAVVPAPVNDAIRSAVGFAIPAIPYAPFQLHAVVMAAFASLFAPFGGFFASGFKRAFNIKGEPCALVFCPARLPADAFLFLTKRLWYAYPGSRRPNRQDGLPVGRFFRSSSKSIKLIARVRPSFPSRFLMGLFAYVYYSSLIRSNIATPSSVLQTIAGMTAEQQIEVARSLGAFLVKKGISPA